MSQPSACDGRGPLVDRFGRIHTSLRISVTDRCNIRCFYCMPDERIRFRPRDEILTFEEIVRFVRVGAQLGINRLRLTGGEPLLRTELVDLVARLTSIEGIADLAMTTNGILLDRYAQALKCAGLRRVNISLDTLDEARFRTIARREGLSAVLRGIFAAKEAGFESIKLNAVAIAGLSEPDVVPLGEFARQHNLELRFIEFMPLDGDRNWDPQQVLSGERIREMLTDAFGPLLPAARPDPSQPAMDFCFADGQGRIGFINPVTAPFCHACNRLRLTAEGQIRNCLFSTAEWDARGLLRSGGSDGQLAELIRDCVAHKRAGHGIDSPDFLRPERAMYQIGG